MVADKTGGKATKPKAKGAADVAYGCATKGGVTKGGATKGGATGYDAAGADMGATGGTDERIEGVVFKRETVTEE